MSVLSRSPTTRHSSGVRQSLADHLDRCFRGLPEDRVRLALGDARDRVDHGPGTRHVALGSRDDHVGVGADEGDVTVECPQRRTEVVVIELSIDRGHERVRGVDVVGRREPGRLELVEQPRAADTQQLVVRVALAQVPRRHGSGREHLVRIDLVARGSEPVDVRRRGLRRVVRDKQRLDPGLAEPPVTRRRAGDRIVASYDRTVHVEDGAAELHATAQGATMVGVAPLPLPHRSPYPHRARPSASPPPFRLDHRYFTSGTRSIFGITEA